MRQTPSYPALRPARVKDFASTLFSASVLAASALTAIGCGSGAGNLAQTVSPASQSTLSGKVYGGQQPLVGTRIYLYAVGTGGYGAAARSLLTDQANPANNYVTTGAGGGFTITGDYTCGSNDQVYLLALGGDAGSGLGNNSGIALMTALGACATNKYPYITVNELTTAAAVFSLSHYMTNATSIGSPMSDLGGVTSAMISAATLVGPVSGQSNPSTASATLPQASLNSLADSIATCVNSGGGSGDPCSQLFGYTTYNSVKPADTIQALLSVAQHPTNNAAQIYALPQGTVPFQPQLGTAPTDWSMPVTLAGDVLTYHNDGSRSGLQPMETALTPTSLKSGRFHKLRSFTVDGQMYADPLYVSQYLMSDGVVHNVVFAATAHGSIYAFDADGNNPAQGYLWKTSLLATGETQVLTADYNNCGDTSPESSQLATPVIDRTTGTLYAVSTTKLVGSTTTFHQRIHAINLADGSEQNNSPTEITATTSGTGAGSVNGVLTFDALKQNQRPALLLTGGNVYISWSSHCDIAPYHGYVMGYSAANVSQRTSLFNNTPNGSDGGIWMSSGGPSVDPAGNIFLVSGNGTFDANTGGPDYGDTAVKLSIPMVGSAYASPTIADYFVPSNQQTLSNQDNDVGVSNVLLFYDNTVNSAASEIAVETDKTGRIIVLNGNNMGHYDSGSGGTDASLQQFTPGGSIFNNFAYFNNTLYVGTDGASLQALAYKPGTGTFNTTPVSSSTYKYANSGSSGGTTPVISNNGSTVDPNNHALVWTQEHVNSSTVLRAYDATDLSTELYNSSTAANNADAGPPPVKFTSPVVAGGHVFVGGGSSLAVYGLQ